MTRACERSEARIAGERFVSLSPERKIAGLPISWQLISKRIFFATDSQIILKSNNLKVYCYKHGLQIHANLVRMHEKL